MILANWEKATNVDPISAQALAQCGTDAIRLVAVRLRAANPALRDSAGSVLRDSGPKAADALPVIVAGLRMDMSRRLVNDLSWLFEHLADPAFRALVAGLRDPSRDVRGGAAYCLGEVQSKAGDPIPLIAAALRDAIKWEKDPAVLTFLKSALERHRR